MQAYLAPRRPRAGARLGATYALPLSKLPAEELEEEKSRLTLQARGGYGAPPPPFAAWRVDNEGYFHCPRFYGLLRFGPPEEDTRVDGDPTDLTFAGTLTPVQERCTEAVFDRQLGPRGEGGVLVSLPCGYGKTVWSVHAACKLKRKAGVLVHKAVLRDQWQAAFEHFAPGVRVGFLQGDRCVMDDVDVVIMMVMTVAKRDFPPDFFNSIGVLFCDEAHHMAAPVMHSALRHFRARHLVALSATKDRPDGLTPLLHWSLGPEGFHVERDCEPVRVSIALYEGAAKEILSRDGKPIDALMLNALAKHPQRNAFIARRIAHMYHNGRTIVVLSDRNVQLDLLRRLLLDAHALPEEAIGVFVGSTKEADRPVQLARRIVLSNYPMANEGLDKKELDVCVMATPKGRITQCVGRIQRPCETKQPPIVLDIADDVHSFQKLRFLRQNTYRKAGYTVQMLSATASGDDDWFR